MKIYTYLILFFFIFISIDLFSQNYTLSINSLKVKEDKVLAKIRYQKNHKDTLSIKNEIEKISNYLKSKGYFTNTIDSSKIIDREFIYFFSLGNKINKAIIQVDLKTLTAIAFKKKEIKNNSITLPTNKVASFLSEISNHLENLGRSFSKVQLKNIYIRNKTIFADLSIEQSQKRLIDKVIIKGYKNFPKSFLTNYFKIDSQTVFSNQKIEELSNATKNLQFVQEIKAPEVLFTKDSTLIYIYVKKKQNNSFDGIVNFASKEDGGLLFNGNLDLILNNILNAGENLELNWNSIGNERQEFRLQTNISYIFDSAISPQASLSIYKQDSTFINTKFDVKLFYELSPKLKFGVSYSSETSEELNNINSPQNITSFKNNFIGGNLQYTIPKNDFFYNNTFFLNANISLGKRKTENANTNQFKINLTSSYIWEIGKKSSVYIKNDTGFLNSDNYLTNELFRIGGARTIRGFNEQSIFAESYTFFTFEYRYLTTEKSYLYSITDIAQIKDVANNQLLGLGLGYLFYSNQSKINISLSVGKTSSTPFDFQNTKLIIGWINYF